MSGEGGRRRVHAAGAIGVFDSGVGGLTVLSALERHLPDESFVYLGDSARLPYGTKSAQTVTRYALQAARVLVEADVKLLVVACNTASSVAIDALRATYVGVPIVGVVEPGADAACAASKTGAIGVMATEGTIRGGAYQRAILDRRPGARVRSVACPVFVTLAEEGWIDGDVPGMVAQHYARSLLAQTRTEDGHEPLDVVVLGCTHFPVLREAIGAAFGGGVALIDSAETTARVVTRALVDRGLSAAPRDSDRRAEGRVRLLSTDAPARFAAVGGRFLGRPVGLEDVEEIDL